MQKKMANIWPGMISSLLCLRMLPAMRLIVDSCNSFYRRLHFLWRLLTGWGRRTARTDSSNTCFKPLCVSAEHSKYLTALILLASFWPCSLLMGEWLLSARACRASLSSRRSILVPIKRMGASGQWCLISGHHLEVTFSNEDGLTTEKHMRKTSVWG